MASADEQVFLGISAGPTDADPAVAAVVKGRVVAYAEEERFVRDKHAVGRYPMRALRYCLAATGKRLDEVSSVTIAFDLGAYTDGRMAEFYASMAKEWPVDQPTIDWQRGCLNQYSIASQEREHHFRWRREFGDIAFPPIKFAPHHYTHAFQAGLESGFESAVALTVDGSGDSHTTVVWHLEDGVLRPLREIHMPHSLGWFYAAFTEYLGFDAYDGEYKVMGLAAHGHPDAALRDLVGQVLMPAQDGVEFRLDPSYIHYGDHSYSRRHTDKLVKLMGAPPRLPGEPVTPWHMNVAFAVQEALEEAACRLVRWAVLETGTTDVCIGGGVGLNVKMNSRIHALPEVANVFAHPLCADSGQAAGAALVTCFRETGAAPRPLTTLALGPEAGDDEIATVLRNAGVPFERSPDICRTIGAELAAGRIVGWCQGRLEAGPRALGQRSILADPRTVAVRDRVNAAIKQREMWRPFGPSMLASAAGRYFDDFTDSRFMTMAFAANDRLRAEAPAIVHTDGTSRVQFVHPDTHPLYHRLITEFEALTGVPILLNTSFNVRGEPIVSSPEDALRTFWATGLDVLAVGDFVVRKGKPAPRGEN
ncbi:carbamoyltransferase family protein [Sinosporangium siamense]|uniref:Nodulation protein n=1 Tax=Sinosporangium siamense TaxID=1367973 RepID=A0A919RHE0_9ACTN|nr:carbamoyltransferase C-terminal domain-containing protein [Sinosporangium siamense]GII92840.1 nodulation protein [Sinosporangium siamense]